MLSSSSSSSSSKPFYVLDNYVNELEFPITPLPLILGSTSTSRQKIVGKLGWKCFHAAPDIDEKAIRSENSYELPLLIAKAKANALIERFSKGELQKPGDQFIILTADQITLYGGTVREKPENDEEAFAFLTSYSDDKVSTVSAIVITHWPSLKQESDIDVAEIFWKAIDEDCVKRIVSRREIFSSAGGFRVEDEDLNPRILRIDGDMTSIMGFPVSLTIRLLQELKSKL